MVNANYRGFRRGIGDESNSPVLELLVGGDLNGTFPRALHIAGAEAGGTNWNVSASSDPAVYIHSNLTPAINYLKFIHDGADGQITSASGTLSLEGTGSIVINNSGGNVDFRVEGANNANMVVVDAGQDAISFGGANVDGSAFTLNNLQKRTAVTVVGHQFNIPAQATVFDNGSGTVAVGAAAFIGIPTYTGDTATLTFTNLSSLHIAGEPVDSTNVTGTDSWAVYVAANDVGLATGNLRFGAKNTFASTEPTQMIVIESGTAPSGAITTSNGVYSTDTTLNKIVAGGTADTIQT